MNLAPELDLYAAPKVRRENPASASRCLGTGTIAVLVVMLSAGQPKRPVRAVARASEHHRVRRLLRAPVFPASPRYTIAGR
jgi:hypothetical protein